MSVIVKDSSGDIWLYCKGADSAVLPLIAEGKIQKATAHVTDFAMVRCPVRAELKLELKRIRNFEKDFLIHAQKIAIVILYLSQFCVSHCRSY